MKIVGLHVDPAEELLNTGIRLSHFSVECVPVEDAAVERVPDDPAAIIRTTDLKDLHYGVRIASRIQAAHEVLPSRSGGNRGRAAMDLPRGP